jgi:hypothetical protein
MTPKQQAQPQKHPRVVGKLVPVRSLLLQFQLLLVLSLSLILTMASAQSVPDYNNNNYNGYDGGGDDYAQQEQPDSLYHDYALRQQEKEVGG